MSIYNRNRSMERFIEPGGSARVWRKNGYEIFVQPPQQYRIVKSCADWVGNPEGDNPLNLQSRNKPRAVVNGRIVQTINSWNFLDNIDFENFRVGFTTLNHGSNPPSFNYLETLALLRASPFARPEVDLWVSGTELVDLPRMLMHFGRLFRDLGNREFRDFIGGLLGADIAVKFGWNPLLDDLRKLVRFTELVNQRMEALNRLESTGSYVKARGRLGKWDHLIVSPDYNTNTIKWGTRRTTTHEAWYSMSHRIRSDNRRLKVWNFDEASRIAFRRDIDAGTIWTRFPWTWLLDWFQNLRDVLYLFRNRVGYHAKDLCLMVHSKTEEVIEHRGFYFNYQRAEDFTMSSPERVFESKLRYVIPLPHPKLAFKPIIGNGHLDILRALLTAQVGDLAMSRGSSRSHLLTILSRGRGQ